MVRVLLGLIAASAMLTHGMQAMKTIRSFDDLPEKSRILLVFAPSPDDARYDDQGQAFGTASSGMQERNLYEVTVLDHGNPGESATVPTPEFAAQLRQRFHVKPGQFEVVLIGYDRGVKMKSQQPISVEDLFSKVDSMPTRKHEMREKH